MPASVRNVDFTNVKDASGINKNRIPEGDYLGYVSKVEDAQAKDETFQYLFTIKIKKHSQAALPYYCKLQDNQLWKLRNLFVAAGLQVPKSKMKLDPNKIVGKSIGVAVSDTEYEGREQSEVSGIFPVSELDDVVVDTSPAGSDDDDDEEIEPIAATTDDDEEEEEEAAPATDPFDAMDRTELKVALKEAVPSFKVFKSTTDDELREALRAASPVAEEEEEEEEEAPTPPPAAKKTRTRPAAKAVSDEELDELDISDI